MALTERKASRSPAPLSRQRKRSQVASHLTSFQFGLLPAGSVNIGGHGVEHKLRSRGLNDEGIPHCPLAPANLDSDMDQTDTGTSYGLVGNNLNFTYGGQDKLKLAANRYVFFQLFLVNVSFHHSHLY